MTVNPPLHTTALHCYGLWPCTLTTGISIVLLRERDSSKPLAEEKVSTCRHSTSTAHTRAVATTSCARHGEEYVARTMQTAAPHVPLVARTDGADVSSYTTSQDSSPCTISMVSVSPLGGGYRTDRTLRTTARACMGQAT